MFSTRCMRFLFIYPAFFAASNATAQEWAQRTTDPQSERVNTTGPNLDRFRSPHSSNLPAVETRDPRATTDNRTQPGRQVAQLPLPRVDGAGGAPGFGVGGAIPDASGRLIDHTYNPGGAALQGLGGFGGLTDPYGTLAAPGLGLGYPGGFGAAPGFGTGGQIPDAQGRLIDHTYRGPGALGGGIADPYADLLGNFAVPGYGGYGLGAEGAGFGTGGQIPDAQGRLIDHTYRGPGAGLGLDSGLYGAPDLGYGTNLGYPPGGGAPGFGTGGQIPDASGRLIDHTYRGGQGQGYSGDGYGRTASAYGSSSGSSSGYYGRSRNSVGTGLLGGGQNNAFFSAQGFYRLSSPYSTTGTTQIAQKGGLVPFTRRTTSPYLNLANGGGGGQGGSLAVRYYGLVKPQISAENAFRNISNQVQQNRELYNAEASAAAMQNQIRAMIAAERARNPDVVRNLDFSSGPRQAQGLAFGGSTGDPQADLHYQARLNQLAAQIATPGLLFSAPNYNYNNRFFAPTFGSGGSVPSNFGNTQQFYGNLQNVPNWKYSR